MTNSMALLPAALSTNTPQMIDSATSTSASNSEASHDHDAPQMFSEMPAQHTDQGACPCREQGSELSDKSAAVSSSAQSGSFPEDASGAAFATPHVLDERPAPKSCPSRCASPLHYYQEQEDSVLGTLVPDGSTNLNAQSVDGRTQEYGFHNLNCCSVFRADGSKLSYYALPAEYSLERAVRAPSCDVYGEKAEEHSTASVSMSTSSLKQHPYEEDQQPSTELPKRPRQLTISSWRPTAGKVDRFSSPSELTPEASQISVHVLQQVTQWDMLLSTAGNNKWDSEFNLEHLQLLHTHECNLLLPGKRISEWDPWIGTSFSLNICMQGLTAGITNEKPLPWLPISGLPKRQSHLQKSSALSVWDPGIREKILVISPVVQWSSSTYIGTSSLEYPGASPQFGTSALQLRVPSWNALIVPEQRIEWDPVILTISLDISQMATSTSLALVISPLSVPWNPGDITALVTAPNKQIDCSCNMQMSEQRKENWDLGATNLSILFPTAACTTELWYIDAAKSIMVQILIVQFHAKKAFNFAHTTMRSYVFQLEWTEECAATVFAQVVPCSRATRVQLTEKSIHLEFLLMDGMLQNGNEPSDRHLADMSQAACMSSHDWVPRTITNFSCWFPSFEMTTNQWDPGITTPSSIYLCLQGWTTGIETEKPLSWLPIPQLADWKSDDQRFFCMGSWYYINWVQVVAAIHRREDQLAHQLQVLYCCALADTVPTSLTKMKAL